jgi:hypothetical protein
MDFMPLEATENLYVFNFLQSVIPKWYMLEFVKQNYDYTRWNQYPLCCYLSDATEITEIHQQPQRLYVLSVCQHVVSNSWLCCHLSVATLTICTANYQQPHELYITPTGSGTKNSFGNVVHLTDYSSLFLLQQEQAYSSMLHKYDKRH